MKSSLIVPNPISATQCTTIKDCLDLPAFNALHEAQVSTSSAKYCKDPLLGTAFIKAVAHDFIKVGGKNIDINFFMDAFGYTPMSVDTKEVYNRYVNDIDHNIYFETPVVASAADTAFNVKVLKANHAGNGKYSYPEKYYSILDKENNIWYSIEDKNTSVDYGHVLTIKPMDATVTGSVVLGKKYLVFPARFVGDFSQPQDTNDAMTMGYAQKVNAFRLRKDWCVKIGLLRGYKDKLRFVIMWDNQGNKITGWDTFEAQKSREALQLALNITAFLATPITSAGLINGAGATNVDDVHTGFYGYLPTLKNGGGVQVDFDAGFGLDLDADLEPFLLQQDALKQTMRFMARHGKSFKASLINRTNQMVRNSDSSQTISPYTRSGEKLTKLEWSAYEYLGFNVDFSEWGVLNDSRLLGSSYFDNLCTWSPMDGIVDGNTGAEMPAVEFYQYGNNGWTGEYYETQNDNRNITREESINGFCTQSIMMATHAPGKHLVMNPENC